MADDAESVVPPLGNRRQIEWAVLSKGSRSGLQKSNRGPFNLNTSDSAQKAAGRRRQRSENSITLKASHDAERMGRIHLALGNRPGPTLEAQRDVAWHGCTLECIASSVARTRGKNAGSSGLLDGMLVSCRTGSNPVASSVGRSSSQQCRHGVVAWMLTGKPERESGLP